MHRWNGRAVLVSAFMVLCGLWLVWVRGTAVAAAAPALIRVLKSLYKLEGVNEDQTVGIRLLARAIEEPLRQIVENAGEDAAVVLNAVKAGKGAYGYNAATGEYGDMLEAGILDPTMIADAPKDERDHEYGGPPGAFSRTDMNARPNGIRLVWTICKLLGCHVGCWCQSNVWLGEGLHTGGVARRLL